MTPTLFLLALAALPDGPVPAELHGRWRVVKEVVNKTPTNDDLYKNLVIDIDANTFTLRDGDNVLECSARANANLKHLLVTPRTGPQADKPFIGLYFLSNDLLNISLPRETSQNPPDRSDAPGVITITLKREK
jgi:uncharacterized protein (TIGR03067 family)